MLSRTRTPLEEAEVDFNLEVLSYLSSLCEKDGGLLEARRNMEDMASFEKSECTEYENPEAQKIFETMQTAFSWNKPALIRELFDILRNSFNEKKEAFEKVAASIHDLDEDNEKQEAEYLVRLEEAKYARNYAQYVLQGCRDHSFQVQVTKNEKDDIKETKSNESELGIGIANSNSLFAVPGSTLAKGIAGFCASYTDSKAQEIFEKRDANWKKYLKKRLKKIKKGIRGDVAAFKLSGEKYRDELYKKCFELINYELEGCKKKPAVISDLSGCKELFSLYKNKE